MRVQCLVCGLIYQIYQGDIKMDKKWIESIRCSQCKSTRKSELSDVSEVIEDDKITSG